MLGLLDDPRALRALGKRLRAESRAYFRAESSMLRPEWLPALAYFARVLALAFAPLVLAVKCVSAGLWPLALPCVGLGALGMYGCFSVFHDCCHGTFVPSKRAGRVIGEALAALLFLDFAAFRTSHLRHHRFNQTTSDPKRLGLPAERLEPWSADEDHLFWGPIRDYPPLLREALYIGSFLLERPRPVRLFFYVAAAAFASPVYVLLNAGEFSILRRDWRRLATWRSAALTVGLYGALFFVSPVLAACLFAAALLSYSFVFMVFLTHLGPEQLYFLEPTLDPTLASLLVSDVHAGPLVRFAGGGFSEHHAAHHLFPQVPIYRLQGPARWFDARFGEHRPAPLDLAARGTLVRVLDAVVSAGARVADVGYRHLRTASGGVVQRIGRGR
jgi:fatty acid desaturase